MSNRFLSTAGSGNTNLTNGSADLFINSLGISNLNQSLPIKTNASRELITSKLDQTDVNNLQTDLSLKSELSYTKSDAARTNPPAGQMKTYFKNDGDFYKKDENGTETKIAGGGTGDVVGPATSTDIAVPRFDGVTGKKIKSSSVTIDESNNLTVPGIVKTNAIEPNNDLSYDIGTTTKRYSSIYCTNFISGSRIIDVNSEVKTSAVNQIATFYDTSGKRIKNSTVTIDASNNCVGMNNLTLGGLTDTQTLNVNGLINAGNNINNFGLITSQGYRMQLDNAVDIGETTKQVKDLYIKGNINTLGDIKYNKVSQNIQLGINAGGSTQGVGCVDNISIGQGSNPALTTGNNNISLGKDSGKLINTGLSNICIGNSSGQTISSGVGNILLGNNAGGSLNTTGGNVCIGNSSAQTLDGNSNVFIGSSSVGGNGVTNAIAIGSSVTNNVSNSAVIGSSALLNIRPSSNRGCSLGTSSNQFDDIYGDRAILNTQVQSNKYYNNAGSAGLDIGTGSVGAVNLTGTKYQGKNNQIVTLNGSGQIQQPSQNATVDGNGNGTFKNLDLLNIAGGGTFRGNKLQSNDASKTLELFNRATLNGVGIIIDNTTEGNVSLTGSAYSGTTNRIFTVDSIGKLQLSSATLDNVGNLTASNTTLASLQLQNNLSFNTDNSHDVGSSTVSARSIYYKTNLSGNTATFTGQINSNAIIPVTTNIADLGSTTNGFRNLYLTASASMTNLLATNTYLKNITLGVFGGTPASAGILNCNSGNVIDTGDVIPIDDNTEDIGTTTKSYKDIHVKGNFLKNGVPRGDVFGPASTINDALAVFSGTSGKSLVASPVTFAGGLMNYNSQNIVNTGYIRPSVDNSLDIGLSTLAYRNIYNKGTFETFSTTNSNNISRIKVGNTTSTDLYQMANIKVYPSTTSDWAIWEGSMGEGCYIAQGGDTTVICNAGDLSSALTWFDEDAGAGYTGWVIDPNGGISTTSDMRLKKNITSLSNFTDRFENINFVHYQMKAIDPEREQDRQKYKDIHCGVIAQEIAEHIPEVVIKRGEYYGVEYSKLNIISHKVLQEQIKKNKELEARITALESRIIALESKIN